MKNKIINIRIEEELYNNLTIYKNNISKLIRDFLYDFVHTNKNNVHTNKKDNNVCTNIKENENVYTKNVYTKKEKKKCQTKQEDNIVSNEVEDNNTNSKNLDIWN